MIMRASGGISEPRRFRARDMGSAAASTPPRPIEKRSQLEPGDRLVMVSDGVIRPGVPVRRACCSRASLPPSPSSLPTAADTVREIHAAVLAETGEDDPDLSDDATAVCLAVA